METRRIRMTVRYDGTDFAGSQIQPRRRTVAGTLKAGLESLLDQQVKLDFASRTDSGVHADGNVCAFDAELPIPVGKLPRLLNPLLPADLEVRDAQIAAAAFSPRFDATGRSYAYRWYLGEDVSVDRRRYVVSHAGGWNRSAADTALALLPGRKSYVGFSGSGLSAEHSVCEINEAEQVVKPNEIELRLSANRFLRHMVCRLAAALAQVASGELSVEQFAQLLDSGERFRSRPAPAKGLTLICVQYPEQVDLR